MKAADLLLAPASNKVSTIVDDLLWVQWVATSLNTSIAFAASISTTGTTGIIAKPDYRPLSAPVNATLSPAIEPNPPARAFGVPTPVHTGNP